MTDEDFKECVFIKKELCFLDYIDFCNNAKAIKELYNKLSYKGKIFYKWYLYANIHMKENFKDLIWEYLNNDEYKVYIELIENITKYKFR